MCDGSPRERYVDMGPSSIVLLVGWLSSPDDSPFDGPGTWDDGSSELRAGVGDGALDTGHMGVPSMVDFTLIELNLDHSPSGIVDVGTNDETFRSSNSAMADGDDVTRQDILRRHCKLGK